MTFHASLTGADLHEPKGVAGAAASTVYVADGTGTGYWVKIHPGIIDEYQIKNINKGMLSVMLPDVSTTSSIYVPIPRTMDIKKFSVTLQAPITGTDPTVGFFDGASIYCGGVTLTASGSSAGTSGYFLPTSNYGFAANQVMRIATDGASTGTAAAIIVFEYVLTDLM